MERGALLEQAACTSSVPGMCLERSWLASAGSLLTHFIFWQQIEGTRNTNADLSKWGEVNMCPDKLLAQDISLEALARDVRNISLKSDIISFPVLVSAEMSGH